MQALSGILAEPIKRGLIVGYRGRRYSILEVHGFSIENQNGRFVLLIVPNRPTPLLATMEKENWGAHL